MATDKAYNPTVFTGQNNFAAGELAPSMEGRADTPLYQSGVKKMINWLVLPSGSIIRRPGTELIYAFGGNIAEDEIKSIKLETVKSGEEFKQRIIREFPKDLAKDKQYTTDAPKSWDQFVNKEAAETANLPKPPISEFTLPPVKKKTDKQSEKNIYEFKK